MMAISLSQGWFIVLLWSASRSVANPMQYPLQLSVPDSDSAYLDVHRVDLIVDNTAPCRAGIFSEYINYPVNKRFEIMTPEVAAVCGKYHYSELLMPNLLMQESQSEAMQAFRQFDDLVHSNCSSKLEFLLCLNYFPLYSQRRDYPTMPQRSLCQQVKSECLHVLRLGGKAWPEHLDCEMLPVQPDVCEDHFYPCVADASQIAQSVVSETEEIDNPTATTPAPLTTTAQPLAMGLHRNWRRSAWNTPQESATVAYRRDTCTLFKKGKTGVPEVGPPESRDLMANLGYVQTRECCRECMVRVKQTVRYMNARRNASMWSWAFVGTVMAADLMVENGKRTFSLIARVDNILESNPILAGNSFVNIRIPGKSEQECLCSRPDFISPNLFVGNTRRDRESGAVILQVHRMDVIWPQPFNSREQPKPVKKWQKLLHSQRKQAARSASAFARHSQPHVNILEARVLPTHSPEAAATSPRAMTAADQGRHRATAVVGVQELPTSSATGSQVVTGHAMGR